MKGHNLHQILHLNIWRIFGGKIITPFFTKELSPVFFFEDWGITTQQRWSQWSAPRRNLETSPRRSLVLHLGGVFQKYCWGTMVSVQKCHLSSESPEPDAQLDISFFQNASVGPSTVSIFVGWWRPGHQKMGNRYVKKRGTFHLHPKHLLYLDTKSDRDSDLAIKHNLIPWSDQGRGVQRWLKTRWGPKHSLLPYKVAQDACQIPIQNYSTLVS